MSVLTKGENDMCNINDFEIEDGVLIQYNGNDDEIIVPNTVTEIGEEAFYECNSMQSRRRWSGISFEAGCPHQYDGGKLRDH